MDLLVQTGLRFLVDPEQKHMPSWTVQDAQLIALAKIHSIWRKFKDGLEMGPTQPIELVQQDRRDKSDNKAKTENMHF